MPPWAAPAEPPEHARSRRLDALLTQAAALIAKRGYEATSIREVGRMAGRSLAGMYHYFSSKEDLLFQIQFRTLGALVAEQEAAAGLPGTAEERLRRLLAGHLDYAARHPNEMKVWTYELESLAGEPYREIEALRRRYYHLMADVVGRLAPSGPPTDSATARHLTMFIFGMLNWVFMWHDPDRDGPVDRLASEMFTLIMEGLPGSGPLPARSDRHPRSLTRTAS